MYNFKKKVVYLSQIKHVMTFDKILENNTLLAVRYDGEDDNSLRKVFNQWDDPEWLREFFIENMADSESYFKITDVDQTIYDTIDDSNELECLILDISPYADLDKLFRPLGNSRTQRWCLAGKRHVCGKERNMPRGCVCMLSSWIRGATP